MITIVEGNLLDAKEDIIGHQVNCAGKMNKGIAKQIRERYPIVYNAYFYFHAKTAPDNLLGRCQLISVGEGNRRVANLFGQPDYGRTNHVYTDYEALGNALVELKNAAIDSGLSVALPYQLGCGLANGDWDGVVYPMLEEIFSDYDLVLYRKE